MDTVHRRAAPHASGGDSHTALLTVSGRQVPSGPDGDRAEVDYSADLLLPGLPFGC